MTDGLGLRPCTVLSLFSGIGGLDLGIKLAVPSARVICYVENDRYCQKVIQARIADGSLDDAPVWDDITTFRGRPWRGKVSLVCGGFPCQDISNAGRREGIDGSRSGLWHHMLRVAREARPRFVYVENVSALLVRGLDTVLGGLSESGYDAEWIVLGADDVGAPHRRKRVFILACRGVGLADTSGLRRGEPCPWDWREVINNGVGKMAHRQCKRLEGWQSQRERLPLDALACECVGDLADSGCERLEGNGEVGSAAGATGRGGGAVVADAALLNGERAVGSGDRRGEPASKAGNGSGALPLFPPGPGERERWAAILRDAPHLEPAVRRMAAGFPSRVDRLRCLGNSVVPVQAAVALQILMRRLEE